MPEIAISLQIQPLDMSTASITTLPDRLSSQLAPEVYDMILDNLHSSKRDLSVCSLVCKSWLPVCRYHLFGEVNYLPDFAKLIEPSTHAASAIAPYIRKVTILGFNLLVNATKELGMVSILNLPNLHHLHIEKSDWNHWKSPTSLSLDATSTRRLSTLHLRSVHFPSFVTLAQFLDLFTSLQNISLDSLSWDELTCNSNEYGSLRISALQPSTLRKLHVVFCHNIVILNWLQYGVISDVLLEGNLMQRRTFPHLAALSLPDVQPAEANAISMFIATLNESLEHLEAGIMVQNSDNRSRSGLSSALDLFSNTKLKTLTIHQITLFQFPFLVEQNPGPSSFVSDSPYAWLPSLLSTIRTASLLHIEFHIWLSDQSQLDALPWPLLCDVLVELGVSRIRLCISGIGRDTDSVKGWFVDRLGGNHRAKFVLEFEFIG